MKPVLTSTPRPFEERLLAELQRLRQHADQRMAHRDGAAAADDLVQETLLRAWQARASFDPGRDLWPWLRTVAENAANRGLEVEARQPLTDRTVTIELEAKRAEPEREPPFDLRPFLAKLRPDEREVVESFYLKGVSIAEIARGRNCPEGTVKSQLSRARMRLARLLAGLMLGLAALGWALWPARLVAPTPARVASHSISVEYLIPEPAKLATRDRSKTTHRGWIVVGAVTPETEGSPMRRKKP